MTDARISLVLPRLDAKPWGGRRLERYGLDLPPGEAVGEALVTAGEATISQGDAAGQTLHQVIEADPEGRLGARARAAVSGRTIFPLLAKLIDASENLSIQVHPDDDGARSLDRVGKTEAWYMLDADPGAKLYLGLKDGVTLDAFMEDARKLDGTSAGDMREVEARPGETVIIPAGTIHALGAGVMVYEIQQPSDVTFRLDDWGRLDAHGTPRTMHLEQGERASRAELRPEVIQPVRLDANRTLLAACRYFALEKLALRPDQSLELANALSPQVLTLLSGVARVGGLTLEPGASAVIWPSEVPAIVCASEAAVLLRAWVPDLAMEIVGPARAASASDQQIAMLGGATQDLQEVLER